MSKENNPSDENASVSVGLQYVRQEAKLRNLVLDYRTKGVISETHAREIGEAADTLYRQEGILTDRNDQRTLHSLSDIQGLSAIHRHGYYLLERKLLELYPQLADEVRNLLMSDRER